MAVFTQKLNVEKQEYYKSEIVKNFDVVVNPKQYAFWEIKNKNFTATFYNSGKFVVQGKSPEILLEKLNMTEIVECEDKPVSIQENHIGTDESGKGDFFGPLVTAGVLINPELKEKFINLGIKDSKKLDDAKILKRANIIKANSVHSVVVITPVKYNELYSKFNNLNKDIQDNNTIMLFNPEIKKGLLK